MERAIELCFPPMHEAFDDTESLTGIGKSTAELSALVAVLANLGGKEHLILRLRTRGNKLLFAFMNSLD